MKNEEYGNEVAEALECQEQIRARLMEVRDLFNSVVKDYRELSLINTRFVTVIKGALPKYETADDVNPPPNEIEDKAYYKAVARLYKKRPTEERLNIILALLKALLPCLEDFRRKDVKLGKTIDKLPLEIEERQEDGTIRMVQNAERFAAIKRRAKVQQTIRVLEARRDELIDRFGVFCTTVLKRMLGQRELLASLFKSNDGIGYDLAFCDQLQKHRVREAAEKLVDFDNALMRHNNKKAVTSAFGSRNK